VTTSASLQIESAAVGPLVEGQLLKDVKTRKKGISRRFLLGTQKTSNVHGRWARFEPPPSKRDH